MWSGLTKRGYMLSKKWLIFRTSYALHEKSFKTLYIFEKLIVLTLERVLIDLDLNNLVTVVGH